MDRDWQGETVRAWTRGFSRSGAHADLEAELHRGRMAKRGFDRDGRPTRTRPRTYGDPLSQPSKTGGDTAGGPLVLQGPDPTRQDVTRLDPT